MPANKKTIQPKVTAFDAPGLNMLPANLQAPKIPHHRPKKASAFFMALQKDVKKQKAYLACALSRPPVSPVGPGESMYLDSASFCQRAVNGEKVHRKLTIFMDRWAPYIGGFYLGDGLHFTEEKTMALYSVIERKSMRFQSPAHLTCRAMPLPSTIIGDFPLDVAAQLGIKVASGTPDSPIRSWAEQAFKALVKVMEGIPAEAAQQALICEVLRWNHQPLPSWYSRGEAPSYTLASHVEWGFRNCTGLGSLNSPINLRSILLPPVETLWLDRRSIRATARGVTLEFLPAVMTKYFGWLSQDDFTAHYDPRSVECIWVRDEATGVDTCCDLYPNLSKLNAMSWDEAAKLRHLTKHHYFRSKPFEMKGLASGNLNTGNL